MEWILILIGFAATLTALALIIKALDGIWDRIVSAFRKS